jgi:DNA-binding transcriptional regulator PaaX
MEWDPMLPQALLPPGYRGQEVQQRHEEIRRQLARRFNALMSE